LLSSTAHGSHFWPQSLQQQSFPWQGCSAPSPSSQQRFRQLGSGAQKSSQCTTHTIFLISRTAHSTRQYFSHSQRLPQWAQQCSLPQVCTSLQGGGALAASSAVAARAARQAASNDIDKATRFIVLSPIRS
jgi:hypothetical protein